MTLTFGYWHRKVNTLFIRRQRTVKHTVILAEVVGAYLEVGFVTESMTATTTSTRTP